LQQQQRQQQQQQQQFTIQAHQLQASRDLGIMQDGHKINPATHLHDQV
jgi:hypothetical protein